jgi:hypothetical protein
MFQISISMTSIADVDAELNGLPLSVAVPFVPTPTAHVGMVQKLIFSKTV